MTNPLDKLISWHIKRDGRERLLLMAAVGIVLVLLGYVALLAPQKNAIKALQQANEDRRTELRAIETSIQASEQNAIESKARIAADQAELERLKKQITEAERFYGHSESGAPGAELPLRELLEGGRGVTITSLTTLPPVAFQLPSRDVGNEVGKEASQSDGRETAMYKYGVEVTLKGNYSALENYLRKLEASSFQLFWASATLNANYPLAELRLTVYALSDQPDMVLP